MSYLSWISHLPKDVLAGAAAVFLLLLFLLWMRFGRRHYLIVKKSDATQLITYELGRIADALDRLAVVNEPSPPPGEQAQTQTHKRLSLSIFGRGI